ncbi:hypothetical protein MFIFM68171_06748 [Madurella fahalii]|uniref:Uncharacterized protein n=1 Tax=Madurella fahalii TaxID=1157608 RepID=A0ABQ0GFL7_9PEZI
MVRNLPDDFQRNYVTSRPLRPAPVASSATLKGVVHGHMEPDGDLATLIVIETRISSDRTTSRIRGVQITAVFAAVGSDPTRDPEVCAVAPDEKQLLGRDPSGVYIPLSGNSYCETRQYGRDNAAVWRVYESEQKKDGIPGLLRTAILLRREDNGKYQMTLRMKIELSRPSFQSALERQQGITGVTDHPIILDPRRNIQRWRLDGVDPANLARVDLHSLVTIQTADLEQVQQAQEATMQTEAAVEAVIDDVMKEQPRKEAVLEQPQEISEEQGLYAELWNLARGAKAASTAHAPVVAFQPWPREPDRALLEEYFPWINDPDSFPLLGEEATEGNISASREGQGRRFSMLGRKSRTVGCKNTRELDELFNGTMLRTVVDFFGLPADYLILRRHNGGICQRNPSDNGRFFAYLYQTPFYNEGFWSLILITDDKPTKGAAVIYTDATITIASLQKQVPDTAAQGLHPLLLLLSLFENHVRETATKFEQVVQQIEKADADLLTQLKMANDPKQRDKASNFGPLGQSLHEARMNLVELTRRRAFEKQIAETLQDDLKGEPALFTRVNMYTSLSQSHEPDIQSLPQRIDSQRTVLYSLIAQQDARLQYHLASESIKDSKAMKTLSIITILFLPGAFVATLFSTDMFEFGEGRGVQISFAIVVPLTVVIMAAWAWWIWKTPYGRTSI